MLLSTLMLLMRAHSQTGSFSSKVNNNLYYPEYESHFSTILSLYFNPWSTGRKVWAFSGYELVQGYPKQLSVFGLPRMVKKIDAALHDVASGKTLFFVGNYYFRCVECIFISNCSVFSCASEPISNNVCILQL